MDRAAIHDTTLKARDLLTNEAREVLQGVYGLASSGKFEPADKLPAVQELLKVKETRKRLEKFLSDEEQAGMKRPEAVEKLVKEVAFTHLNRLVAFKMLESRKLIRGIIDRYQDSNDFKMYLADHDEDYRLYQAGLLPQDAVGEGPRDTAYRHFILWQCAEMAREIKVLFDPENLPSRLFPRPRALKNLLEMLNDSALEEAWSREETIGWIYQYFNEDEKKEVFNRLYKKKLKIRPEDIPAATQLFTPRWIVKFLVQNTLGRQWMQMHPDSRLATSLDYLVPLAGEIPTVPLKPVREIEVLDPACGTMHFGLVAFDLLAEMYREEMEKAGQPGWLEKPSVASAEAIPAAIIANNIFGIDIDLRAVQLSALTLYLKAKSLNPKASITESHLACAELQLPDDSKLEEFLRSRKFTLPVYERIIRSLWGTIRSGSGKGVGSLLPLEGAINLLVERERAAHLSSLQRFEDLADAPEDVADTEVWGPEFWEILGDQIVVAFDDFARQQAEAGEDETCFTGEAVKGMRLLDVMRRRYDVVFTNPPYMTRRNMNPELADFVEANYPEGERDLYTAFIQRCSELLKQSGRLGMVAQQSFMFISSYENLREVLLKEQAIEAMAHVGPHAFEDIGGEKVNITNFIIRNEPDHKKRFNAEGTYFRLVKEPDSEAKRASFERALARLRARQENPTVYRYRQADFTSIPGSPWVYWNTPGLRRLFMKLPKLEEIAQVRQGLATADNFRFLRFWWEVGTGQVGFRFKSHEEAKVSGKKWFPHMKGGSFQRWYGNQEYVIAFDKPNYDILATVGNKLPSRHLYFCRGVTWSRTTSKSISARFMDEGFVFDCEAASAFYRNEKYLLAILNSSIAAQLLLMMNPTVHFQIGDVAQLPIPGDDAINTHELVDHAISISQTTSAEDETTFDFIAPPWAASLNETLNEVRLQDDSLKDVEKAIDEEVYLLYGISDEDRRAIETELAEPAAEGEYAEEKSEQDYIDKEELALRWISYAVGIVMGRFQPGVSGALGQGRFPPEVAEQLRALTDSDGVATLDEGHQDDLARKVWEALEIMLGEAGASEVVETALEKGNPETLLRRFLAKNFFKRHLQQYRKRPIYWLLESPERSYSVYVFHERATRDTLPLILGSGYVAGKINYLQNKMNGIQEEMKSSEGKKRKDLEKSAGAD